MCYKKNGIIFLIIILLCLLCCIGKDCYINKNIKDTVVSITQEIGRFSTDKIYLIDLITETYKGVNFIGETQCNDMNHVDVTFLTTKTGRRLAEIKIESIEDKITVKYNYNDFKMALYDPNTGKIFCVSKNGIFAEWLDYDIYIDQVSQKIEIVRKNNFDYVTKF